MRVCIIGYSGSGKSTFAKKMGDFYQVAPTYIDKLHFNSGWIERDPEDRNRDLQEVVEHEHWVIDGNYSQAVPIRFELSDQIFIFNFNRVKCLYGAIVRRIRYRNKARISMTEGNAERLDWEFVKWILRDSRTKTRRMFYHTLKKEYPNKVTEFKKRKQVNAYLKSLGIYDFKACS